MKNILYNLLSFFGVCIRTSNNSRVRGKLSLPDELCRQFSLDEIRSATRDFHPSLIIGRGGSATVFKGLIDDGSLLVAVKVVLKADSSSQGGFEDFRNEVLLLCQLRHQHLVPLIGFCDEKDKMILVYNYMSNGTLYYNLHRSSTAHHPLSWKQRLEICIGVARGLHYLHTGAKRAIIHRDIKTKNILLDDQRVPKLADFGMSKIGPFSLSNAPLRIELPSLDDDQLTTTVAGTVGYIDPEFFFNATIVTDKSDIYSFGVVLFEVLCGRKVIKRDVEEEQRNLIRWVNKCMKNGSIYAAMDPCLKGKIAPRCLEKFLEIAFSCVQLEGNKRPAIGEVQETLELALELQNKAYMEMESNNPHGGGMYEEVIFSASAFDVDDDANIQGSHGSFSGYCFKTEDTILSDVE